MPSRCIHRATCRTGASPSLRRVRQGRCCSTPSATSRPGERWPDGSPVDDARRRRTQGRWLEVTSRLIGIHPNASDSVREQIAGRLGVATMTLRSAAETWFTVDDWSLRGAAVLLVVAKLEATASLPDCLLAAGAVAGLWPAPQRWVERLATRPGPFRSVHSTTSLAGAPRAPPNTTSPAEDRENVAHCRARD